MFGDIAAAFNTISHTLLLSRIYILTTDGTFTELIENMLYNRRNALDNIGEYYTRHELRVNTDMLIPYPKQRNQPKTEQLVVRLKNLEHTPT